MYVVERAIAVVLNVLAILAIALIGVVACVLALIDCAQKKTRELARDLFQKVWKSLLS